MEPLCNVPPCDIFTWSIYSIKSPTSWNHKYILFTPSTITTQSVVTKHIIIMDPVVRTHPCGARRGCGEDTVIWSRGDGEVWRAGWWWPVLSADNGPTTCHHHQLGSSSSHNKHGTQSTFIRKHFWINMAFDLRKKGAVKRIVFLCDRLKMIQIKICAYVMIP